MTEVNNSARVDFGGGDAVDENLLFGLEVRADEGRLFAVLEVGAAALEYDVSGRGLELGVELRVGDGARAQVCSAEAFEVVTRDARSLRRDDGSVRRCVRDELYRLAQAVVV